MIITVTCNPCIDKSFTVKGLRPEAKLRAKDVRYDPGGGGINVSRVLSRFGCDTMAYGLAGGHTGRALRELLDHEGVPHQLVQVKEPTRINVTVLDEQDGAQYVFSLPGTHVENSEWKTLVTAVNNCEPKPQLIVLSGSLPQGLEDSSYAELAKHAKAQSIGVVIDASGEPLRKTFSLNPLLVKPNRRELELISGRELTEIPAILDAARQVLEIGAQSAVVSLGEQGALAVNQEGAWLASAPLVRTVSKVGAGDSMVAALVRSLVMGSELKDALRLGVAAGTAATISPGTELCRIQDVNRLLPKVEVKPL